MNSKKRALMAVKHLEPDRIPLAFGATSEVIERLTKFFGIETEEDLLRMLKIDFRNVNPILKVKTYGDFFGDPLIEDLGNGCFKDIWGITFKEVDYGYGTYVEYIESPLSRISHISDIEAYQAPNVHDIWNFSNIERDAELSGEYAVVYDGAVLFQFCQALRGFEELLLDLSSNPLLARAILEKVVSYWIEFGTSLLKAADGAVDFFVVNDDYGMQQGPLFNPNVWRQYIKPSIWKVIKAYKKYGVKIIFHSCGSVKPFIPDLIEMGVDVLDPIQVSSKDMNPSILKREFGERISFRGAIDTQKVLPYGTVDEVKEEVKNRIYQLAPGGGYIATSVHNLQPDVPIVNILAMLEAIWEYGSYPLSTA